MEIVSARVVLIAQITNIAQMEIVSARIILIADDKSKYENQNINLF